MLQTNQVLDIIFWVAFIALLPGLFHLGKLFTRWFMARYLSTDTLIIRVKRKDGQIVETKVGVKSSIVDQLMLIEKNTPIHDGNNHG